MNSKYWKSEQTMYDGTLFNWSVQHVLVSERISRVYFFYFRQSAKGV
jgi:hypothetical protein